MMDTLNPWDARSVARWAAAKVSAGDDVKTLWTRRTLDGPGYMLTKPEESPRSGMWNRVAVITVEDAMNIAQRAPRGWPALCRLSEKIEMFLVPPQQLPDTHTRE